MKNTPRWWWILPVLMVILIGGLWYLGAPGKDQPTPATAPTRGSAPPQPLRTPPAIERLPVKTLEAAKRDLEVILPVFGTITYLDKVEVASEVQGVLKTVNVEPGDQVTKNQVLAVLDTELLQKDLQARTAMMAQAQAQLKNALWQYEAQQKLYRVGGATLSALEEAEANYRSRQAEVQRFAAEAAQIRTQIKKSTIRAPIDGLVATRNFNVGERVPTLGRSDEKGIVTLMRLDEVYALAEVSERDLVNLRPGLEVNVIPDAYPSSRLLGKIARLEPVLKEESRTVVAKIRVPNPDNRLRPGMFARLEIVRDKTPDVVAIPKAALQVGPDKSPQVFVVLDEVAFLRKVVPGLATEHWLEIKDGIKPGEAVVVEGAERLKDLARVVSSPATPPEPAKISPSPGATTGLPGSSPVIPSPKEPPSAPVIVPQPQTQDKPAEKNSGRQEPPPGTSRASQEPKGLQELPGATTSPAPKPPEPARESEATRPVVHQVTPGEGLLKIVAAYYPDDVKETGYDAVILANPHITNEDIIHPGQELSLPKVDRSNKVISLENNEHFALFKQYYTSAEVEQAVSKLKELQLHVVVRDTQISNGGKSYRIFLGGYSSKDDLKKARNTAEKTE